jgi:acetyl-CoA carboxylase biotin carboxyl carrier protein
MSLSYKDVAEIIKMVDASSCDEIIIEMPGSRIVVRRSSRGGDLPASAPAPAVMHQAAMSLPQSAAPPAAVKKPMLADAATGKPIIRSPMVGTFYRAPTPKDPPFVDVGSAVNVGDPLCIIEVMKLFTTITADRAGRVAFIYPDNAELVEFDQPLFQIEPA